MGFGLVGPGLKEPFGFMNELEKNLFTAKLTINFHRGNVGKIQVARTIKNADLSPHFPFKKKLSRKNITRIQLVSATVG